jgi:hypothetical protein
VGQVLGVAAFVGIYLGAAPDGSAHALAVTTAVLAAVLALTAACAVAPRRAAYSAGAASSGRA